MSALVSDVAALVDAIGAPVHLVGHDWGAAVAWSTAAGYPDLVRTLTAVSVPHPRRSSARCSAAVRSCARTTSALFQIPWLPEFVLPPASGCVAGCSAAAGMTPEQIAQVQTDVVDGGALTPSLNWYRAMPFASPRYTRKVSAPTTYVWSTGDIALGRRGADADAHAS